MSSGTFLVGMALSELEKKEPEGFERGYVTATLGAWLDIVPSSENTGLNIAKQMNAFYVPDMCYCLIGLNI